MMRAVMYGAGNIGRGFIGQLFADSGYKITFIDTAKPVVDALNREGRYPVRFISNDGSRGIWVGGVSAVNGEDREKTAEAIAAADIMATAVGVRILPHIAPLIAQGIKKRFSRNDAPLNIIICENLIEADKLLGKLIKENLDTKEQLLFDQRIGLVEASIGRMVPIQTAEMRDGNPLRICTEEYSFLPVDKNAFRGKIPVIKGMEAFDNFAFFIERKLFIHNMGHGICAYLGMFFGDTFIYEAINRRDILSIAQSAMMESARALSKRYKVPLAGLEDHINDLLSRFSNRALGDTCARVGGDTARKLGAEDRFIGAIRLCEEEAVTPACISIGAAAALFRHLDDSNSPQDPETAAKALFQLSGLSQASPAGNLVLSMYSTQFLKKPLK
ncbi:MAG: mannitol-1-phosphate 5-dehydrogenase [Treponema sp.]|nr:mannitol-1-phosphate 5-dehydrogenase [Treponema sp.]